MGLNCRLHTNKQCKHSKGGLDVILSKFNNPKNTIKCAQNIVCTHVQCVSNRNNEQSLHIKFED